MARKINYWISIGVLGLFLLTGLIVVTTFFHEYVHYNDLHRFASEDQFCVLNYEPGWSGALGYYAFRYNLAYEEDIQYNSRYTEYRGYTMSILIIVIFFYAVVYVITTNIFKD